MGFLGYCVPSFSSYHNPILTSTKPGLSTKLAAPKKDVKTTKGVQSAAVRAFLEKREKEEKEISKYRVYNYLL